MFCSGLFLLVAVFLVGNTEDLSSLRARARTGDANAQYTLGRKYAKGRGVEQDYAKAARWFRRAARKGDVMAQRILAQMYFEGKGVDQDYVTAGKWYLKAAEKGLVGAEFGLGEMFEQGLGEIETGSGFVFKY